MEKSQTPAGKISIGLQLGGASLESRNLSIGCLRFFGLALLLVLDPLAFMELSDCCFTYIMARKHYFRRDEVHFVLD